MPHPVTVSEHIKERLIKIRGDVRLYRDMVPERTAFVAIDMQNAFVAPGGPIEVAQSRTIVPVINRMAKGCRELDIPVIWIRSHHPKGGADWRPFFDYYVRPERREAAAARCPTTRQARSSTRRWTSRTATTS